ncbi:MAG: UvrD-helicase domain-containing protein [Alphaproteobacteria bacterium]|nr:UvrD-helicase domain-containing protein [Alphaproteobacteria bacterium]
MSDFFELTEDDLSVPAENKPSVDLPFLSDLNPEQRQAVEQTEGPVLVLSGAGTGKTRVLTTRIAYLLATGLASPWQILAVTFTNKASREMKERLEQMIGLPARSVWLGTFHSVGIKILSRYTSEAGLKPNFIVLNTDDQERLLKKIMQENGIDTKQYTPATLLDIIQRWKDRGLSPTAVTPTEDSNFCNGRARGFYQLYQNRLRELNAVDFGDLLLLPLELFKTHPDILALYQSKFKYILVDEYQDTNVAQYLMLRLLTQKQKNICCVGDDDQSIYSWRGAEVENILNFQKIYPEATIIRLERNYRSTAHILGAASGLIAHNAGRLGKTLKVADTRDGYGDKVHLKGYWNGSEEAEGVIDQIETEQRRGKPLSKMAVLVRISAQTRPFEEQLIKRGIPYKIIGGFKFYEREEIRDAVAYLRLVLNTSDDLAFTRIVNKPRRGIGDSTIDALEQAAKEHHISLFDAIAWAELRPSVRRALDAFAGLIKMMRDKLNTLDPAPLARQLLEDSGYMNMWRSDKSPEAEGRLENIKELYNVLDEFETINDFIEYAALVTDADENTTEDQLVVMTLHASKGLEFDCVFLTGWEEGLFPHQKAMDESGEEGLEEERRLAYVGITRAREKAFISFATNRRIYGQWENALPSRFIDELPADHIQNETTVSMGYGNQGFSHTKVNPYRYEESPFAAPTHQSVDPYWNSNLPHHQASKSRRVGKRVYHESFGYGTVIKETPNGLEVHFDDFGLKKVQARFLSEA